jgi:hypothetical protein
MQMREAKHMVMVIDEHGGIDGLVTIGDVIETILVKLPTEYDIADDDFVTTRPDSTVILDAAVLVDFEQHFGPISRRRRAENDTISGLPSLSGHVPARAIVRHPASGIKFEIIDGDAAFITWLKLARPPMKRALISFGAGILAAASLPQAGWTNFIYDLTPWSFPLYALAVYWLYRQISEPYLIIHAYLWASGYFLFGLSWVGNALLVGGNPYVAWPLAVIGLPLLFSFLAIILVVLRFGARVKLATFVCRGVLHC